uniref:PDZ domain-containing protein n=1 Tax=Chaetoceros debilis TaxID=122233 RepID=A0A6S8X1G7_9STRA|mmetsp:Transcript_5348/g.7934  ORF Transcript_5348/g.7934 Transcript_5348/m.7934 type:complete len:403 (+) Transcript_5348:98-1306(+)
MKGFLSKIQKDLGIGPKKNNNRGGGQSLGGKKAGTIISVSISTPGSIGIQLENTSEGHAIIGKVVGGSAAELAGLQRGDIVCFPHTEGAREMEYRRFLDMAKSTVRPMVFDVRRVEINVASSSNQGRADTYARKQAVIAAAEARDKKNKIQKKPIGKSRELTAEEREKIQKKKDENEKINAIYMTKEPMSDEARKAVEAAKVDEAKHVAKLGYNPYEAARSTGKQGAVATASSKHGSIDAPEANMSSSKGSGSVGNTGPGAGSKKSSSATTKKSNTSENPHPNLLTPIDPTFDVAFTTLVTASESPAELSKSLRIMRKLINNAVTGGQTDEKKRLVRISNPNKHIQAAINEQDGAIELMLSTGFLIGEKDEDNETYLIYPEGDSGPSWLPNALERLEQYENS